MGDWSRKAIRGIITSDVGLLKSAFKSGNINEEVTEDFEFGGVHFGCRHGHKLYGPLLSKQKPGDTILDLAYRNNASGEVIDMIVALGGQASNASEPIESEDVDDKIAAEDDE